MSIRASSKALPPWTPLGASPGSLVEACIVKPASSQPAKDGGAPEPFPRPAVPFTVLAALSVSVLLVRLLQ